ncbi:hypothetical protein F1188_07720 [Roseospira marina]|uniref:Phospholipase D n=1 Tax=Roseospira marina TaxID=140057 RepID=A0A5M6IEA3_9PROT|nr:phospholipase D-like domain-containing protein [Roseospira marina]KAA5606297.1 hypothetical protein F1188_07720 [Roseospira marina]MBB4314457.1 phosphatidylserine/phosphatidylglycerophosphate/cardiolipin synthase-like enzyme [Roseospira marina]MBB5087617.1 phosphatidylserine/phosphatidylglycerophosphate/cardiolipin synthase-like enzyme [Roseospira marina]
MAPTATGSAARSVDDRPASVTPLFEAAETYRCLADAVAEARETVHMAYWSVQPDLSLDGHTVRDEPGPPGRPDSNPVCGESDAPDRDCPAWAELLADAARRGVVVRMILSDFDPILVPSEHRRAWHSYRRFCEIRDALPADRRANFQIMCSRHSAAVGPVPRLLGQPLLHARLRRAVKALGPEEDPERPDRLADAAMLWPHLKPPRTAGGPSRPRFASFLSAYPAVHHEKSCIIDGAVGFVGGLDIDRVRFDTRRHTSLRPWHDVAVRLEGPMVADLAVHFAERWSNEVAAFRRRHAEAAAHRPVGVLLPEAEPLTSAIDPPAVPGRAAQGRIVRTVSGHRRSLFALGPKRRVSGTAEAVETIIRQAREHLYIENQFLRSGRVAGWLAEQGQRCPDLRLIVVLPLAPERLGGGWNAANRHGQYLQRQALRRLSAAFGPRFGLYTLLTRHAPPDNDHPLRADLGAEDTARGSDGIYVHAKVMIADDRVAMIGSANLNGRSLSVDTETSVVWTDPEGVVDFRKALWRRHLGRSITGSADPFDLWHEHARADARRAPEARTGFVVPMSIERATVHARRSWLVPDRMV